LHRYFSEIKNKNIVFFVSLCLVRLVVNKIYKKEISTMKPLGGEIDLRRRPKELDAKINSRPSFFQIWAESEGDDPVCCKNRVESIERILNGEILKPEVRNEIVFRH